MLSLGLSVQCLDAQCALQDFWAGGTDMMTGILGYMAIADSFQRNGTWLAIVIIWGFTNACFFDVLSLGSNLKSISIFMGGSNPVSRDIGFVLDNILLVVNIGVQAYLAWLSKTTLKTLVPNWSDQLSGSTSQTSSNQQPLLYSSPKSQQVGQPTAVKAFSGGGNKLGGGTSTGSGSQKSKLLS